MPLFRFAGTSAAPPVFSGTPDANVFLPATPLRVSTCCAVDRQGGAETARRPGGAPQIAAPRRSSPRARLSNSFVVSRHAGGVYQAFNRTPVATLCIQWLENECDSHQWAFFKCLFLVLVFGRPAAAQWPLAVSARCAGYRWRPDDL